MPLPLVGLRRFGTYATHYFDCNPFKYRRSSCFNPFETALTYLLNRTRFRAVAAPYGVIDVDPRKIPWNLRVAAHKWPLGTILDGNWDTALRRPVDIAWKISSMEQRFRHGLEWEETDLFRFFYPPRFARGEVGVKRKANIVELAAHYRRVYDPLFEAMQRNGFRTPSLESPEITFAYVHIDREGGFMYTLEGNHRLGMAIALGLESIPVRVVTRHQAWQNVREETHRDPTATGRHSGHPDLADLVKGHSS